MMKKIAALFVMGIIISSCGSGGLIDVSAKKYTYEEGVEYAVKMERNDEMSRKGDGKGVLYYDSNGDIFKVILMEISNTTDKDVEIDFKDFILLDNDDRRYDPVGVMQLYKPTPTVEKFKHILKAGKTRSFFVDYWPQFPKGESVRRMVVKRVPVTIDKV